MSGVVRIASTEGIAAHWLVPRLGQLRRTHPDIIVQVIASDQVLDLATRQLQILTDSDRDESPSFAPNGRMILFATVLGGSGVLSAISVDGVMG